MARDDLDSECIEREGRKGHDGAICISIAIGMSRHWAAPVPEHRKPNDIRLDLCKDYLIVTTASSSMGAQADGKPQSHLQEAQRLPSGPDAM